MRVFCRDRREKKVFVLLEKTSFNKHLTRSFVKSLLLSLNAVSSSCVYATNTETQSKPTKPSTTAQSTSPCANSYKLKLACKNSKKPKLNSSSNARNTRIKSLNWKRAKKTVSNPFNYVRRRSKRAEKKNLNSWSIKSHISKSLRSRFRTSEQQRAHLTLVEKVCLRIHALLETLFDNNKYLRLEEGIIQITLIPP